MLFLDIQFNINKYVLLTVSFFHSCITVIDIPTRDSEIANSFIRRYTGSSLLIFTDGSVCNGPVGFGACAAVLFPIVNNGDAQKQQIVTKAIGKMVCSEKCEMEGVILGLQMSVEYLRHTVSTVTSRKLFVFCDCATVINKLHLFELDEYPDILQRFHTVLVSFMNYAYQSTWLKFKVISASLEMTLLIFS